MPLHICLLLALFHDLVPPLQCLRHLDVHIHLHVIDRHLDYIISLINFLDLLLRLIPQNLNLALPPLLSLLQLVVEGSLSLG